MSDKIPQIPLKNVSKTQFPLIEFQNAHALIQTQDGSLLFPWNPIAKAKPKQVQTQEQKIKAKVKEIQNKLSPDVPKLSDKFVEKVVLLAQEIKCEPEDLLAIMYHESGGWDPAIIGKGEDGTIYGGLIQMNKNSLKIVTDKYSEKFNLKKGITMNEYLKLSREKQIDYARGYFILLKDTCNLDNKTHLTAGETWGMLKSPKRTKDHDQKFLGRLQKFVEKIKSKIFVQQTGQKLNIKNG